MISRKVMWYVACVTQAGIMTAVHADDTRSAQTNLSVGLAGQSQPRYSGSDERRWQVVPLIQARDGAFFLNSQQGLGYDLQSTNGLYLEHSLGYSSGRSDRNSAWQDGSDKLKGMGKISAAVNTAVAVGWTVTSWFSVEGKAILPLSESQGVNYQTSATLIPLQTSTDTVAFSMAALFGDSRYINTFYGVSDQQSDRTGYAQYRTAGGFYGADTNLTWSHQFTPHWSSLISADYVWLEGRAADSPIVFRRNETSVTLGGLYTF